MKKRHIHIDDMPEGYSCPVCPDHEDDDFVWCEMTGVHVCVGCSYDLEYEFDCEERPDSEYARRVEKVSGKTFEELRLETWSSWLRAYEGWLENMDEAKEWDNREFSRAELKKEYLKGVERYRSLISKHYPDSVQKSP